MDMLLHHMPVFSFKICINCTKILNDLKTRYTIDEQLHNYAKECIRAKIDQNLIPN